jgi:CheY-like chemotaxis protein
MPGATGYEICRAVKAGRADTPVLLLVGTFEPFEPSEIEECGAEGHLKKPFDSQELLRLAEDLLLAPRLEGPVEQIDRVGEDEGGQGAGEIQQESDEASFVGISAEPATDETVSADAFAIEIESGETTEAVVETAESETEAQVGIEDQPVMSMSEEDVDRVARRVIELLSEEVVREIAWDVIPDLAEIVIKDRLRELESQVD